MNKDSFIAFVFGILVLSNIAFAQSTQTNLSNVIQQFKQFGQFDFYLPFIMVFAILFGMIQRTKLFDRGLSAVIALASAGFVMIYTPAGITLAGFFANFFAETVVVMLTIIVVVVFMALLKGVAPDTEYGTWWKENANLIIFGALAIFVVLGVSIFVSSGGLGIFPGINFGFSAGGSGLDTTTWALIILLIGTALIVFMVSREDKPTTNGRTPAAGTGRPPGS